ncbi:hypothetical protein MTX78_23595 (plasmid) [Hymenobacter tibetensis]|uniref:Uncharacterized protein n=1 Tax=Hymenobacter tibetensis TaxID=497967 RepID=A0ABY4DBE4_9BACT|nr:hypothetical protein [Hymenobacter tibetensis]UOG77423.1 hypothetical protein MTX78_23595 [Hymenobacter tibetensis]
MNSCNQPTVEVQLLAEEQTMSADPEQLRTQVGLPVLLAKPLVEPLKATGRTVQLRPTGETKPFVYHELVQGTR